MANSTTFSVVIVVVITFATHRYIVSRSKLPQGIRPLPGKSLVGNLLDISTIHSWIRYKEWSDVYGLLFRLNLASRKHYVAVSTDKDFLRERGNIYSSCEQISAAVQLLRGSLRASILSAR